MPVVRRSLPKSTQKQTILFFYITVDSEIFIFYTFNIMLH